MKYEIVKYQIKEKADKNDEEMEVKKEEVGEEEDVVDQEMDNDEQQTKIMNVK